jgi:hypothetical protein
MNDNLATRWKTINFGLGGAIKGRDDDKKARENIRMA